MHPCRRRDAPEYVQRILVAFGEKPVHHCRQQNRVVGNHNIGKQATALVADGHLQIGAPAQFLAAIDLGHGGAQLMVGLNAVFAAMYIALQLGVTQVAQRVNTTNQFVVLKEGSARAVMPAIQSIIIALMNQQNRGGVEMNSSGYFCKNLFF